MRQLIEERYPIYEEADIIVQSQDGRHEDTVSDVITALQRLRDVIAFDLPLGRDPSRQRLLQAGGASQCLVQCGEQGLSLGGMITGQDESACHRLCRAVIAVAQADEAQAQERAADALLPPVFDIGARWRKFDHAVVAH